MEAVDSRRRVKREITPATEALGTPFKPYFACPGVPWGSRIRCLPTTFVIRRVCDLLIHAKSCSLKQNCHPACPGVPWDRSVAKCRDLLFLCPSDATAPNESSYTALCHPERSRGICSFIFGRNEAAG